MGARLRTSPRVLRVPSTTRGCSPAARPRPARGGPLGFGFHLSSSSRGVYTVATEPLRRAPWAAWSALGGRLGGLQGCLRPRHQRRWHQACARTHLPITSRSSTVSANVSAGLCGGAVCSDLVFELDSMLVVMFMLGMWGCHRNHLRVLLQECHDLGEALTFRGCTWTIRHVYREYNIVADQLAGQAIQASRCLTSP